jgi:DNA-binding PadR family transcriptional regulator
MQQEVVLAMLAKEPSYGYQLRARLRDALGPLGDAMNAGQVYVTLTRLEKAGLVAVERSADGADRSDRKVYALTPTGQQRVAEWIAEVSWPRPDLAEFHLKLVAAAAAGLADPLAIVDTQRSFERHMRAENRSERTIASYDCPVLAPSVARAHGRRHRCSPPSALPDNPALQSRQAGGGPWTQAADLARGPQ